MLTIDTLKEYGANVEEGLSRCMGNEDLYLRLVKMCAEELASSDLGEALKEADLDRAFSAAHKLKGGVTNLSLTPLSEPVCELTELLRNKTPGDYDGLYDQIMKKADELSALVE